MTVQTNNAEATAGAGVAVTTSNQTGATSSSGAAYNTVTPGAGGSITYDAFAHTGSLAYRLAPASGIACLLQRSGLCLTVFRDRFAVAFSTAAPSVQLQFMIFRNASASAGTLRLNTNGTLGFYDAGGTLRHTFTTSAAANTYVVFDFVVTPGTSSTTGRMQIDMYSATGTTPLDSYDSGATLNLGSAPITIFQKVHPAVADTTTIWFDDDSWDDASTITTLQGPMTYATVPVGNAGPDQTVDPLSTVTLAGSATNTPTSRAWTQTSGTTVTLSSSTIDGPTFTAPADANGQTLVFSYTATNAAGTSTADTVTITVNPQIRWIAGASTWQPTAKVQLT